MFCPSWVFWPLNCNVSEGYFLVPPAVSFCFFSFLKLNLSWVLDSQMDCRWLYICHWFHFRRICIALCHFSHFVFDMNKTTPPASFIRGVWKLQTILLVLSRNGGLLTRGAEFSCRASQESLMTLRWPCSSLSYSAPSVDREEITWILLEGCVIEYS